jgi:hypothetical protein
MKRKLPPAHHAHLLQVDKAAKSSLFHKGVVPNGFPQSEEPQAVGWPHTKQQQQLFGSTPTLKN